MSEETQKPEESGKPTTPSDKGDGAKSVPNFEELQASLKEVREKLGTAASKDDVAKELESLKGAADVVSRIKKAIDGNVDPKSIEADKAKAAFYALLVEDPVAAIRQVFQLEREKDLAAQREKTADELFSRFQADYPEYKKFEEEMKEELLANPGWFGQKDFVRRVFFDVLGRKDPGLLAKIISEGRGTSSSDKPFLFEGASQTLHGPGAETGEAFVNRLKSAGAPKDKSIFV